MPPKLALLLCTIFVLFLLRMDRKQAPDVSLAMWIPTIWFLYISSKPLAAWFGATGLTVESGSSSDRIFLVTLLCLGLLILVKRRISWSTAAKYYPWLIALLAYMLISIIWSDIPFISFKRWSRELLAVIMAFTVATEESPQLAMEIIIRRLVYILIPFSLLLIKYFGEYGRMYNRWSGEEMWIGVTSHKNSLGMLCIISTFFLVWTLLRRWRRPEIHVVRYQTILEAFVLIITFWLLIGGSTGVYSATSVTVLVAGLFTLLALLLWIKKLPYFLGARAWMIIMAFVIGFGIITPIYSGSNLAAFTSILGRNETITGRTEIWKGLLNYVEERPILGLGFGSFWTTSTIEEFEVSESHNGYLEVQLELGIVGLALITIFLLSCTRMAHQKLSSDYYWGSLWISFLLMFLLHNISEATINSLARPPTAIILFLAVSSKRLTLPRTKT